MLSSSNIVRTFLFIFQRGLHFFSTRLRVGCPTFSREILAHSRRLPFPVVRLSPAAPSETTPSAVSVPSLKFQHETLPNGLEVYSVEDHSSPTVAIQVWYHVGSKDDPDKRSGFAHLFEHMMFKGNEHLAPDAFENLTENIGGENNAFTADDMTVYHEVVPSNYLNPILWAEAERMSSLAVNDANFSSERDVVKEEDRQRILANPYGEFYLSIAQNSYAAHPYKRPGIGNIAELDASKLSEVRAFHATFYRPDNATLIVVGDFQPNELHGWIDKYFGAIQKPAEKIPRVTTKEPSRKEDKRVVAYSPKVALPALAVTYLAPSIRSNDAPALELADEICLVAIRRGSIRRSFTSSRSCRRSPSAPICTRTPACSRCGSFGQWQEAG